MRQLTNKYVESLATLAQVSNNLVQTEVALKTSQEETAKRDAKIAGLEAQNQALDKQAVDLSTAITNLTTQIEETKRKLATSEGEKGFLEKELKRLMAEKSELEKQFNDLTVLRAQVSKLKEELSVARRLEWIRQGLFASSEQRGAQKLMQGSRCHAGQSSQARLRSQRGSQLRRLRQSHPAFDQPSRSDQSAAQVTDARLLIDSQGRVLRDLRVSITDRCNFRCLYCLPETEAAQNFYRGHWAHLPNPAPIVQQWVPKAHILSFEEIERVVRLAVSLGIQKVRLTGGEPLLRHNVEDLVARIARIPGITDLAMTTNGFLFPHKAQALRAAGLRRISFSLDSLDGR